jgi:predicted ATPase
VPITSLRVRNFKSFADSGDIPLAPLTVVFGRNNTGKSSILQSLLLLRQTLDTPGYGGRLNLVGPQYAAGSYADIVHKHSMAEHAAFEISVQDEERGFSGAIELEFAPDEPQAPRLCRLKISGDDTEALEIKRGRGAGGPFEMAIGGKNLGNEKKANFFFSVADFLPEIGEAIPTVGRPNKGQRESRAASRRILDLLRKSLSSIHAVSAFRSAPLRRYEFQGRGSSMFSPTGEDVINALIEDATRRRRRGRGELISTVNRWLEIVGGVRLLPIRRISKTAGIFEIRLKDTDSGRWANFADVGFGIGQALPVLVEGLRTTEGGMFLVQEPEIHLHPDAQLGMADFLVDLVHRSRRVLVETHSENLLLRIRHCVLGIANGRGRKNRLRPEDVSIIHVDKNRQGTSQVRQLKIDDLGQILEWPPGFMGEATRERMEIMERMADEADPGN